MFKKADFILAAVIAVIGIGSSVLAAQSGTIGEDVTVTTEGELYGTYSLFENQTIEIRDAGHLNEIRIEGGSVQMIAADCHNQLCVEQGRISQTNQSIVCLPNKVIVSITGGRAASDAVSH